MIIALVSMFCFLLGVAIGFWRGAVFGCKLVARANGGVAALDRTKAALESGQRAKGRITAGLCPTPRCKGTLGHSGPCWGVPGRPI